MNRPPPRPRLTRQAVDRWEVGVTKDGQARLASPPKVRPEGGWRAAIAGLFGRRRR